MSTWKQKIDAAAADAQDHIAKLAHGDPVAKFDRENAFMLYAAFCGDVERTAHAINVRPVDVLKVAEEEGWNDKLRSILELKKSNRPGDIERAINRALNFVQSHRFRLFLERMLSRICNMSPEEAEEYLMQTSTSKSGTVTQKLSTRPLADLASALEKCHAMTYAALNDTATERGKRSDTQDPHTSGGELHAQISNALAGVRAGNSPRAQLFDAQLSAGQAEVARSETVERDDTHEGEDG